MADNENLIAVLREQEDALVLAGFDQTDAWSLGRTMAEKAPLCADTLREWPATPEGRRH